MPEIERKFLVKNIKSINNIITRKNIIQGYLSLDADRTVRIRIKEKEAFLTIKGKSSKNGLTRYEFEKEITLKEAEELLDICIKPLIYKERLTVNYKNQIFEVDIFSGENKGLIIAELELKEENESFIPPPWLGKEVTGDNKYYNSKLVKTPYKKWKK